MLQILNQTVCLLHPVSESPKNTKLNQIYFKSLTSDLTHDDKTQSLRCNRSANRPGVATTITHLYREREREHSIWFDCSTVNQVHYNYLHTKKWNM